MKKFLKVMSVALVVVMMVSIMAVSAFAADSKEAAIEVTNGATVTAPAADAAVPTAEDAAAAIDKDIAASDLTVAWENILTAETYPATVTFAIEGQPDTAYCYLLKWNEETSEWDYVAYGQGADFDVEIEEEGLYAIVMQSASSTVVPSDATGEMNWTVVVAAVVAVMAGTAAVVTFRKVEA